MVNYCLTKNALSIEDSYKVTHRADMELELNYIRNTNPDKCDYPIFKRSNKNLIREWCSHNLFYNLNLFRSHTKTVDFESPQKWYFKVAYFIGSLFYV